MIGALDTGGAERQQAHLANELAGRGHQVVMATLFPGGRNWDWLEKRGRVRPIPLFRHRPTTRAGWMLTLARAPFRLQRLLSARKPGVVYSALYLTNLIAWLATRRVPTTLVWGIRGSNVGMNLTRAVPFRLCRWMSPRVPVLIANSRAGLDFHERAGYRARRHEVIPNGIDTDLFRPDPALRSRFRARWEVGDEETLIGLVARLDPMKDHANFLRAAAKLYAGRSDVRFVCVGDGRPAYRRELEAMGTRLGLADRLIWAGEQSDMVAVSNGLDIACSASAYGEGFANAIGEAMACGVPCVVTDVGDAASVVGEAGVVVPPRDPHRLAEGWRQVLALSPEARRAISRAARERMVSRFSVDRLVERTERLLAGSGHG